MKMLQYSLVSIFSVVILILATLGTKPLVHRFRPLPYAQLPAMAYGKKMCIEQSMPVITVNRDRRWFINTREVTSFNEMEIFLLEQQKLQRKYSRKAYVRLRIDQSCPARDFLDLHAMAKECGFDGILIAGTVPKS